jgi:hypothetical protein
MFYAHIYLRIPLPHFNHPPLAQVKANRPDFRHLDEVGWLTDNFRFSDAEAVYELEPGDPYKTLMFQLARN